MTINTTQFRNRFSEFCDYVEYSDSKIQMFIDDAKLYLGDDENRWNGKYDLAQSYLAAHLLVVAFKTEIGDTSSAMGSIISKSAGGVSVTKSAGAKNRSDLDDFYISTSYGQQFLNLRNLCFVSVFVANEL